MAGELETPRYCGRCGEIFEAALNVCPECGSRWPHALPHDLIASYALLLTEIQNLHRQGTITDSAFRQLQRVYEARLLAVRPERKPKPAPVPEPAPGAPIAVEVPRPAAPAVIQRPPEPAPAAAAPLPAAPPRPAVPPRPPKPPSHVRRDLRNWAARRQADLVLYLGAFLLSISALIFVSYTGSGGVVKSVLFGLYTLLFLVLGIQLRKWTRVQEAGPVFLALGAVLVPLNFVALYTNVLRHDDVPQEYVWLAGSLSTAALYSLLAWRGFGTLYWLPAGGAYFAAYASLGACLHFGPEWYGPWFVALAVAGVFAAHQLPLPGRIRGYVEAGSYALGILGVLYTHQAVAVEDGAHAAIPVAYSLATIALVRSSFPSRRAAFLGPLPPVAVMAVTSAGWAVDSWSQTVLNWSSLALLAVAAGYVAVAWLTPRFGRLWASISLCLGAAAMLLTHGMVADGGTPWRLPIAYAASTAIAAGWYAARRYVAALAFVPPLMAATAATTFWAADSLAFEWLGTFVALAGIGYVVTARLRPSEAAGCRTLAGLFGVLSLAVAHSAATFDDINRWELPTVYALVAGGAAFDALRFRPSAVVSAFALALGGASALWALEVGPAYWAFPALAISLAILAAERLWAGDERLRRYAWPVALVLAFSPLLLVVPQYDDPWVGAASFALSAVAMFGLSWRTNGALSALFQQATARPGLLERRVLAALGCWALFVAGAFVNLALELTRVEAAWTFAVTGIVLWLVAAALRSRARAIEDVLGPVGLSAFGVALVSAWDAPGHTSMMAGLAAVTGSLAIGGRYVPLWRATYAGASLLALAVAHVHAVDVGVAAWQLPAAYGLVLVALLWDSAWNRFQPAMLFVPAVTTVGAATAIWWREWPEQHMAWTPLALALGIAATEPLWQRGRIVRQAAWPYVLVLALAPVALVGFYESEPWYGVAAFALASAAWVTTIVRGDGAIGRLLGARSEVAPTVERQLLAFGAFGLGLSAVGYTVQGLDQPRTTGAWAAAGVSIASWAAIVGLRGRLRTFEEVVGPASLTGVAVAVAASLPHQQHTAMILGVTTVAAALVVGGRFPFAWRAVYAATSAGALFAAHSYAQEASTGAWQLPAAYGLVLAALLWDSAWNRCQPAMLFVPAVGAAGATAFAWWREWPHVHWAWAPLAIALALAVSEKLWMRGQVVRRGGWWYVLGLSLAPFLLLEPYREEPWPGAAAFALAAIAWAVAAWRSEGTVGQLFSLNTALTPRAERRAIALGSYGLGLIALGHFNQALGLSRPEAGWTYAAVGAAAILLTCVPHERVRDWLDTVTFAGFVGFGIGVASAGTHAGELSAMFALAAVTFTASGLVNRSDNRLIVAALSAVVSGALLWSWREWPLWSLSLVYDGAAAVLFVTFAPARKARTPFPAASSFLSVAPILLAVATSGISVLLRDLDQQFNGFGGSTEGDSITRTPEWFATVVNVAIGGSMLVFEAFYRRSRQAAVAGSAVLLVALEMAIASLEIDNIQVYTAPLAIYVIGLGLSVRQSQPFFGHHMLLHETLFVVGAAILVLPAAEQSFEPGGANWGLLVIVQGMALLAVGLTLFQRWLAVAGVVTLVAVAARFVFDNTANGNIPYWVMLGVAGLALLGVGVLMLLERDWWDRTKARMARWWLEGERPEPPGPGAPSAPAPQP